MTMNTSFTRLDESVANLACDIQKGKKKIIAGNFRHMIPAFFEKYWHFFSYNLQRTEA